MKILALDLATKTGWAYSLGKDKPIESGVENFKPKRGDSPGMRFLYFDSFLERVGGLFKPDLIVYEMPYGKGDYSKEILFGLSTRVQSYCALNQITHSTIHASSLKKYATGRGNASKDEMLCEAQARFPDKKIVDDNEADALLMLEWARDELVPRLQEKSPSV